MKAEGNCGQGPRETVHEPRKLNRTNSGGTAVAWHTPAKKEKSNREETSERGNP